MHNKNLWIYTFVIVVCCASLLFAVDQETPQKPKSETVGADSFIRMDLLTAEKKPMPTPKRNIFTQKSAAVFEGLSPEAIEKKIEEARGTTDSPAQGENSISPLNLRYLGYVLSGRKVVGLIVFRGEALAVVEGELIAEGFTIGRINPDEIEVLGSDREPMMFPIEGEFP
ncbi:MAG: hypothetical protein PVI66_09030 [Candidatus Aminicenantes bacterium]|jgi:hypothetical protein